MKLTQITDTMKSLVIITTIALVCLFIGLNQRSQLAGLREETAGLAAANHSRMSSRSIERHEKNRGPSGGIAVAVREVSPAKIIDEIEKIFVLRYELKADQKPGVTPDAQFKVDALALDKRLSKCFSGLDHHVVLDLLQRLRKNSTMPDSAKGYFSEECVDYLQQSNPAEAIRLLLTYPDVAYRENRIIGAFYNWGSENPTQAIHWFEEESERGNPLTKNPGMLKCAMASQARIDPVRALSRALTDDVAANPDSLSNLGATIAVTLRNAGEQLAFLMALRKLQEKSPGSEILTKIRSSYIPQLSNDLMDWPFEEASALINREMTRNEKIAAAESFSCRGDLPDPLLWATWMLGLDHPPNDKHPVRGMVRNGVTNDDKAIGEWLEQVPSGDLKNRLIVDYAWFVADRDPACAMQWAMSLAEGPQRKKIVRQVGEKWEEKDPSAAAVFAKEHEQPE